MRKIKIKMISHVFVHIILHVRLFTYFKLYHMGLFLNLEPRLSNLTLVSRAFLSFVIFSSMSHEGGRWMHANHTLSISIFESIRTQYYYTLLSTQATRE